MDIHLDELYITIFIPSISDYMDLIVSINIKIEELIDACLFLLRKCNYHYPKSKQLLLIRGYDNSIMNPNFTLKDCFIINGEILYLI